MNDTPETGLALADCPNSPMRRRLLAIVGLGLVAPVAGCSSSSIGASMRSWCRSSPNCTSYEPEPGERAR